MQILPISWFIMIYKISIFMMSWDFKTYGVKGGSVFNQILMEVNEVADLLAEECASRSTITLDVM